MRQNYQISEQFPSYEEEEALKFPVFARKDYWLLHVGKEKFVPITIRNHHQEIIAFWCFGKINDKLISPVNAPFFTPYLIEIDHKELLFKEVLIYCKLNFNLPIQFTLKSDWNVQKLQNLVSSLKIMKVELGSQLSVSNHRFIELIDKKRKRRKLNSLLTDKDFEIQKVRNDEWEGIYLKNVTWRKEKKHLNFMSPEEMTKSKLQFPRSYQAFQLKKNGVLIGTAYFLMIDENLIYVYSLITAPAFDSDEPSLLLWEAIYDFAKKRNVSTIDMGTSMIPDGRINKSLAHYKNFIGGLYYKKYTFEC